MRSWLAYKLIRWALWADTEMTIRMALALSAESARRELEARGLMLVPGEDGVPVLRSIHETPPTTVH